MIEMKNEAIKAKVNRNWKGREDRMKTTIRRFFINLAEGSLLSVAMAGLFLLGAVFIPSAVTYGNVKSAGQMKTQDSPDAGSETDDLVGTATVRSEEEKTEAASEDDFRVVKSHSGRIGVYRTDGSMESELDLAAYSLTDYDRELLRTGIVVEGKEELSELLESLRS